MSSQSGLFVHLANGNVGIGTTMPMAAFHVVGDTMSGAGGYPYYATLGTSNVVNPPSSSGTVNGVNITALNKRTRTSYASAVECVSTWTARTSAADNEWRTVCWAPKLSLFVAVSYTGTGNRVMTSPDGITWTSRTSAADNNWVSVCWSPELSIFVAVAFSGTGNRVMTSPDGITWTIRTSAADNDWFSVCWAPELMLFVAVARSGTGNRVMTSPNGITWTIRTSAADNNWYSVCWSPELSIFVAVGITGTGNRVMTSPDGINWTARTSPVDNGWVSVCWSPELSLFVAVAISGTGNRVMTSPDGITWTARTSAADNNWYSVCWSPELSLFVAVAITGTGNRVMTSPNGITWTARTSPVDNGWLSVCWAPELSIFLAIAYTGTGNRVMTSAIGMPNAKSVVKALPSQMTVLPNGNVGIGITQPSTILNIQAITPILRMTADVEKDATLQLLESYSTNTAPRFGFEMRYQGVANRIEFNKYNDSTTPETALTISRESGVLKHFSYLGATNNTTIAGLTMRAVTTGVAAAGIGCGIFFRTPKRKRGIRWMLII